MVNVNYFTIGSGGTDAAPVLYNSDAWRTWNDALFHLDAGGEAIPPTYGMYGGIIAVVMSLTGISVTAGLMVAGRRARSTYIRQRPGRPRRTRL